jgi:hypothetical protein
MSKTIARKSRPLPLPFSVFEAAKHGDAEAMAKVLKHYEGYIAIMSRHKQYDENGNSHYTADDEIQRIVEADLMYKLTHFDPGRVK